MFDFDVNITKSKVKMRCHSEHSVQTLSAYVDTCQTINRHAISRNSRLIRFVDDKTNQKRHLAIYRVQHM